MMMRTMRWTILGLVAFAALSGNVNGDEIAIDSAMYSDPKFDVPPPVVVYSTKSKFKSLWLKALAHPEFDLKRQVAVSIARAHQRGLPDILDTAAPLTVELDAKNQHPLVRLAAARALVVLDARQAADVLFKHVGTEGIDMAQLVEPALAKWDYRPARKVWLERLADKQTSRQLTLLAIRGLATVLETKATPDLLILATSSDLSSAVRLEAARGLGRLQTEGLQNEARDLARNKSRQGFLDRLVAASLLAGHRGKEAESLLLELAVDSAPTVSAIALTRLLEIDPGLVIPIIDDVISRPDAKVRDLGAQALVARPTDESIAKLGPMLDDPHPDVRKYVRDSLFTLASAPQHHIRDEVILASTKMLASDRWRGLEQAALLLAVLDHKQAADRMVELLDFERPEVFVTVAWSLRQLAVKSTLEGMLDKAQRQIKVKAEAESGIETNKAVDEQVSQLFQAFGEMNFRKSEPLLRAQIPKSYVYSQLRSAAIWTLGHFYAGNPQDDLIKLFSERLADTTNPFYPEFQRVRRMSAVSLGRMKATAALPTLRKFYKEETEYTQAGYACIWAINQMTGEEIPKLKPFKTKSKANWFLVPLGPAASQRQEK